MKIICVDDEELALDNLVSLLRRVEPQAEVAGFMEVDDAYEYLKKHQVHIAFLDIELQDKNGMEFAKICKEFNESMNIIFVSAYSQYLLDAFKLRASGYLMKPVREVDLIAEIKNLRSPLPINPTKRVRVQTFGHFEVFVDQQLLKFTRTKCKECLAYLIDRKGARITYPDLSAILWEDRPFDRTVQNNTQRIISDLMKTLDNVHLRELIIKSRYDIAINTSLIDCDYYVALTGDIKKMNTFTGEYMSNYSWAEFTLGELTKQTKL